MNTTVDNNPVITSPVTQTRAPFAKRFHDVPFHIILLFFGLLTFYPLVFTLFTSFKDNPQFYSTFWGPAFPLHFSNYQSAWDAIGSKIWNTMFIALVSVIGTLFFASLTAYVFARHSFPLKNAIFMAILGLLMIPGILTLISSFLLIKNFHLLNTYWALILPYIAGGQAFAIFVLRSFMSALPEEIFESARMDGASELTLYFRMAIPLSLPILGTLAIFQVLGIWNDYIWPLVVLSDNSLWTISLALVDFTNTQYTTLQQYGPMFAAYVIAALPLIILFIFTMKLFIAGIATGAIKA